jgi:hypothetical protein
MGKYDWLEASLQASVNKAFAPHPAVSFTGSGPSRRMVIDEKKTISYRYYRLSYLQATWIAIHVIGFHANEVKEIRGVDDTMLELVTLEVDLADTDWEPTYEFTYADLGSEWQEIDGGCDPIKEQATWQPERTQEEMVRSARQYLMVQRPLRIGHPHAFTTITSLTS